MNTEVTTDQSRGRGAGLALTAALLGWMFDGLEMGLFPLVARPALIDLLNLDPSAPNVDTLVGWWTGTIMAAFLVGAASGGVIFGWLGDRLGRVRAMTLSVITYALFSGLCGLANSATEVAVFRFIAALGMGGEWSLGVALVNELWPNKSRALLAGLIGAAANLGYLIIALVGIGLTSIAGRLKAFLYDTKLLPDNWTDWLTAHDCWRILMLLGLVPGLLTFFIRIFVPESEKWEREHQKGSTSNWSSYDLLAVIAGTAMSLIMITLWRVGPEVLGQQVVLIRAVGTIVCLAGAALGFLYPSLRFLSRRKSARALSPESVGNSVPSEGELSDGTIISRMLLGSLLSGIALIGTWGSIQWAPTWADQMISQQIKSEPENAKQLMTLKPYSKSLTQVASSLGAIIGTILAALAGDWLGRRLSYTLLCGLSFGSMYLLYQYNTQFGAFFLFCVFLGGCMTASFYGWLPLYLPELFPTAIRASGQGFSFNFGRLLAAIGTLQTGTLIKDVFKDSYPQACFVVTLIYFLGFVVWFAPETKGRSLPE